MFKNNIKDYINLEQQIYKLYKLRNAINLLYSNNLITSPIKSINAGSEAILNLKQIFHSIVTSQEIKNLIDLCNQQQDKLEHSQLINLRKIEKQHILATLIDSNLQNEHEYNINKAEGIYHKARLENNFDLVKRELKNVIETTKKIADIKASYLNLTPYESLIDNYDPNRKLDFLKNNFNIIKKQLPDIIQSAQIKQKQWVLKPINNILRDDQQIGLINIIAKYLGFNFKKGRIDYSKQYFCGGSQHDVRILIRKEGNFLENIMKVIHEIGHGIYEQNLPQKYGDLPVGKAAGMGAHESQSIIMEQIGKSYEFISLISKILRDKLLIKDHTLDAGNLYKHICSIKQNVNRLYSDELFYLLHIIHRCEIEEDMINGNISVDDLPEIWNVKSQLYLNFKPRNFAEGCLQDIHWFRGYFGYFSSYFIGTLASSQLMKKIENKHPNIFQQIEAGNFKNINVWLNNNVRNFGSIKTFDKIICDSTGSELSSDYFLTYLRQKYL